MPQPHFETEHYRIPLAYLITFRSNGTWLHGDPRGSVDRFHNLYGSPRLPPSSQRMQYEQRLLDLNPIKLNSSQRAAVEKGIRDTCRIRKWRLWAFNIRTNHVHTVGLGQLSSLAGLECFESECYSYFERCGLLEKFT